MFDDEKIKLIETMPESDKILIIWIKLLILAGKKNENGYISLTKSIPYTDGTLATILNRPIDMIQSALNLLKKFEMISCDNNGVMKIVNWQKHQNIDGLDRIREQNRSRQQKFRENHPKASVSPEPEEPSQNTKEKTVKFYELFFEKTQKNKNRIPKKVTPMLKNTIFRTVEVLTQSQYEKVLDRCIRLKGTGQSWEYYLDSVWREAEKIESVKHKNETPTVGAILNKMANGKK